MFNYSMSFLLARLIIGISFFGHGCFRIPVLSTFSDGMVRQFEHSILPQQLVLVFSYVLPFIELTIGLLLLAGLFTRQALIAGALLMMLLIFGCTTIQHYDPIQLQLTHSIFCIVLLVFVNQYNTFAVDSYITEKIKK